MYAVIQHGGKQYRVSEGDRIRVSLMKSGEGETVQLERVLAVVDGSSLSLKAQELKNASVTAEVLSHGREDRVIAYKYRKRKNSHCKKGHRQGFTEVVIKSINR